jgi:hypothetical protein
VFAIPRLTVYRAQSICRVVVAGAVVPGWCRMSKSHFAFKPGVCRDQLTCPGMLAPRSHAVVAGCLGTLWSRGGMSRERADCPQMLRLFVACEVGRYVSFWDACVVHRWRPYRVECTGSLPTSEVKRRRARLVLGWGTAREDLRVLPAFRACIVASCGLQWPFCPSLCWCTSPSSDSRSAVAQWLACWAHNPKVRGSKPRCAISRFSVAVRSRAVRCLKCGRRGSNSRP